LPNIGDFDQATTKYVLNGAPRTHVRVRKGEATDPQIVVECVRKCSIILNLYLCFKHFIVESNLTFFLII